MGGLRDMGSVRVMLCVWGEMGAICVCVCVCV